MGQESTQRLGPRQYEGCRCPVLPHHSRVALCTGAFIAVRASGLCRLAPCVHSGFGGSSRVSSIWGGVPSACPFSHAVASCPTGTAGSSTKTMSQPALSPFAWVRRALSIAALFVMVGWVVGLAGALSRPWVGMILGALGLFLFGSAWATSRIGGAGIGAGLIGFIASLGMALEGHHALVAASAVIVEQPSLASWDPRSDIIALRVGELRHLRSQEGWARVRRGSGKSASTTSMIVTPLFDPALKQVVGFHCRSMADPSRKDGTWVLSSAAWAGSGPVECGPGLSLAVAKCQKAGIAIEEGAVARMVEVFATEAALRQAHKLQMAVTIPIAFLLLYSLLVICFCRRGAASVD